MLLIILYLPWPLRRDHHNIKCASRPRQDPFQDHAGVSISCQALWLSAAAFMKGRLRPSPSADPSSGMPGGSDRAHRQMFHHNQRHHCRDCPLRRRRPITASTPAYSIPTTCGATQIREEGIGVTSPSSWTTLRPTVESGNLPSHQSMVTSFSSKSELALNRSVDGQSSPYGI